jgi:hypothetical protein
MFITTLKKSHPIGPVRQVEGAGAQPLLKPLFWGKTRL